MVFCERCEEEVEELTKTTGTCPTCAKEEVEMADDCFDIDDETSIEAQKCGHLVEHSLRKEGYNLDDIPDRRHGITRYQKYRK